MVSMSAHHDQTTTKSNDVNYFIDWSLCWLTKGNDHIVMKENVNSPFTGQIPTSRIETNHVQRRITCWKLTIETLEQRCEISSKLTIKTPKQTYFTLWTYFTPSF